MTWVWITLGLIVLLGIAVIVLVQPGAYKGSHRGAKPKRVVVTRAAVGGVVPVPPEETSTTLPRQTAEENREME